MILRNIKKIVAISVGTTFGISWYSIYSDRPSADNGDAKYEGKKPDKFSPTVTLPARAMTSATVTAISKVYLGKLNNFVSYGGEILEEALKNRKGGQSLITVTNHTSTVDDPSILACLLPFRYGLLPSLSRWSLCSQEYCYQKGNLISTFFYAGKVLPIKRGGGIDHKMLEDFFQKVESGEWVHIFPEGKIDQSGHLSGRPEPDRERIGRLKWGVGKLIARASIPPVVLPIYHIGMQEVMPQRKNKLKGMMPKIGKDIFVRVGKPIFFDDLIEEYNSLPNVEDWNSSETERSIYSRMTRRIEDALLELERETYIMKQEGQNTK